MADRQKCYIAYDRNQMTNLQESMHKEILLTNRNGAYCCTTPVGCNIRKYHGLLVVPTHDMDERKQVLLSMLDETIVQHGAEFNLEIHKYQGDNYSPRGHKYITRFEWEKVPTIYYRIGGVQLKKELLFCGDEDRLLIRYTLLDAHSPTTIRLKPFLAYRLAREFTHKNGRYDGRREAIANGTSMKMYDGFPRLYMQLNHSNVFIDKPDWYMGLDYPRERERGYSSNEDLYCPGYFELPIKKGEPIVFSAGLTELPPTSLKRLMDREVEKKIPMSDIYHCLVCSADQFHQTYGGENYLVSGYPWFKSRARDFCVSLPGLTLSLGKVDKFELLMKTLGKAISEFIKGSEPTTRVREVHHPDVLLWYVWALQQYAKHTSAEKLYKKYGNSIREVFSYLQTGGHPGLYVHTSGLLYAKQETGPVTWMNSTTNGYAIIPRHGYVVEFNALWYNNLGFWAEILREQGQDVEADEFERLQAKVGESFRATFINKFGYLYDYIGNNGPNWDVRPNMIFAVALPYSPLSRDERKKVLDYCTRELLTAKGLRSLTPKSGAYKPFYEGSQEQRNPAYHQGTAWPWLMGFYLEAYYKVHKRSGLSFIERQLIGYEEEMEYHGLGSIPEMFDGNPPFHGRGAISFAMNVAGILRAIRLLDDKKQD